MRVDIEEIDACTKRLSIEVPPEDVHRAFERAYIRLRQSVRLPGFRKGKVPRHLLEKHYRDTVERNVLETLIPESYLAALEERSIQAIGQPKVDAVEMNEREPLRFQATVEVIPPFELPAFEGREFQKPIPRVTEEDVDHMLEHLKEQHVQLEGVEGRPVQEGDYVILDVQGTLDGVERDDLRSEGQAFLVGQQSLLPELEEALPGMNAGETRHVEAVFPEDHRNSELAGKTVHFRVRLHEIKTPVYPELDGDFAKSLGEYDSMDALRAVIREDLEKTAEQEGVSALKKNILNVLEEETELQVPRGLIDSEREFLFQQIRSMVDPAARGGLDKEKLSAEVEPRAVKNVRQRIILDHIGARENIAVTPTQVEAEIRRMAERYRRPYAEFRDYLEKRDGLVGIEEELRRSKTLDFLASRVKAVVIEDDRSVLAGHGHDHDEEVETIESPPVPAEPPTEE